MTAYEMRISDWSSDVCSSDLPLVNGWALYTGSKAKRDRPPSRWSKHGELPAQQSRAGLRGADRATRSIGNLVTAASRTRSRRERQLSLLKIGRAPGRERVGQSVENTVAALT